MAPSVDTAAAVPERTHEQRMRALRGERDPLKRAQLKRDLKAGKVKIETLLLDPPDYVLSAKAFDMILAVPKYGRVKANKILTQCRISPSKTIGGLSAAPARRAGRAAAPVAPPERSPATVPGASFARTSPVMVHRVATLDGEPPGVRKDSARVEGLRDHRARRGSARGR